MNQDIDDFITYIDASNNVGLPEKFLKNKFDIDVKLDFEVRNEIVGKDIKEIAKPRKGGRVFNPPNLRIAIKTTKMKNVWLIVPQKELEDSYRTSDVYILTRVDLYLNHFLRFLKLHNIFKNLRKIIPDFYPLSAEICGFVLKDELKSNLPVKKLPSPKQEIQPSYILRSGEIEKSKDDWKELLNRL